MKPLKYIAAASVVLAGMLAMQPVMADEITGVVIDNVIEDEAEGFTGDVAEGFSLDAGSDSGDDTISFDGEDEAEGYTGDIAGDEIEGFAEALGEDVVSITYRDSYKDNNGYLNLRFVTEVKDDGSIARFGTWIVSEDYFNDINSNSDTLAKVKAERTGPLDKVNVDGEYKRGFTADLMGIPTDYENMKFYAKSFVVFENGSSEQSDVKYTTPRAREGASRYDLGVPDFETRFVNRDVYLYRVGNSNVVSLGTLFKERNGASIDSSTVDVKIETVDNTAASGTWTKDISDWTNGKIQFSGTGIVKVTINDKNAANEENIAEELLLEVVDGKNVTTYSELSSASKYVLLNDIEMPSGQKSLAGSTLYGNGFTFDVTRGANRGNKSNSGTGNYILSNNYVIYMNNSYIDNINIVGAVYTKYGATVGDECNNPVILAIGNNTITNSCISNCASPVRAYGDNLKIINTTLRGGNFANLDIRSGSVILDNVTTVNQVNSNDKAADGSDVFGFGIVFFNDAASTSSLTVNNLTQYNCISTDDVDKLSGSAKTLTNCMFSYNDLKYNDGTRDWVNTGVLSMNGSIPRNNIQGLDNNYFNTDVSINFLGTSYTGYVCTTSAKDTADKIGQTAPVYSPEKQKDIAPEYVFDNSADTVAYTGTASHKYWDSVSKSFDIGVYTGQTVEWDPMRVTAIKIGNTLPYEVKLDDEAVNGKINFTTADIGKHRIVYTYTDPYNYNEKGERGHDTVYTHTYDIEVREIKSKTYNAKYTFYARTKSGITDTYSDTKKIDFDDKKFVMPDVTGNVTDKITSFTATDSKGNTETFYCPIVYSGTERLADNLFAYDYHIYINVFAGVQIKDYDDNGNETVSYEYDKTSEKPTDFSIKGWNYNGSFKVGSHTFENQNLKTKTPLEFFTENEKLVYGYHGRINDENSTDNVITYSMFSYKDAAGETCYFIIANKIMKYGYGLNDYPESSGSGSGGSSSGNCLAEGTLITLADGTQKPIEQLTFDDELVVWDMFKGEYTVSKPSLLIYDGVDDWDIINLKFSDGTVLRDIYEHGLYDVESNGYVYINKDNAASYIGHDFVRYVNGENKTVRLTGYEITNEHTGCYTLLTAYHNNCIANGLLTVTPPPQPGWYDYFKIGEGMKYDEALMQDDIAKYGLYEYSAFSDYVSYDEFLAFNGPYLKVLVGKGLISYEDIVEQINEFVYISGQSAENNPYLN